MRSYKQYFFIMIIGLILSASVTEDSFAAKRKLKSKARLDEVYLLLTKANSDVDRGREIQALKGFLLGVNELKLIQKQHPEFEPKEVADIIKVLNAQTEVLKRRVMKDGLVEYRGKTLSLEAFTKMIKKEKDRQERGDRFQKWQAEERRRRNAQRIQNETRRQAEERRLQRELHRQREDKRLRDETRRQAQQRREVQDRRRRYEEQQRRLEQQRRMDHR